MSSTSSHPTNNRRGDSQDEMDIQKWLESTVVKVGFPIAAASVLIYFLIFTINRDVKEIKDAIGSHVSQNQELKNSVDALRNSSNEQKNEQARTNLILQQICVNGSAARDRANCFR